MKRIIIIMYFINFSLLNHAQGHFNKIWNGNGTGHMVFYLLKTTIADVNMEEGDEIAVFDGTNCVGIFILKNQINPDSFDINNRIICSKSDTEQIDGFTVDHNIIFKFWDASNNKEIFNIKAEYLGMNDLKTIPIQTFEANGSALIRLSGLNEVCQTLSFKVGWNIFSVSNQSVQSAIDTVFQSLINNNSLVKIQDEAGNSLEDWGIFGGWTNGIGNINPAEGYKIKVSRTDSVEICGVPVDYPFAIPLNAGWNIMGYPQTKSIEGLGIVQQLIDRGTLIKVQDELGNSIEDWGIFGGWQNNIGDFTAGEGFKIKLNAKDTLWIYDSYQKSTFIQPELVATTHYKPKFEGNGVDHMNINLVGLPINILKAGDELAIFDGKTCVGSVTIMPNHLKNQAVSIAASATDEQGMSGFAEGNPITLKLWNSINHQEFVLDPEIVNGTSTFTKHETTVASLEKYAITGLEGFPGSGNTEINCYPNPFSDKVTVEINLAADALVQVEVLNQIGQQVKMITTKQLFPGGLHKLEWNGKGAGNQSITPGVYYLKLNIDGNYMQRKIVYLK